MDALQVILAFEAADPVRLLPLDPALDRHVPRAGLSGLLQHFLIVQSQDPGQAAGNQRAVLAVLIDLRRAEIDVLHRGADGEQRSPSIVDPAARTRSRRFTELLADRQRLIVIMVRDLQPVQPRDQDRKGDQAAQDRQRQNPAQHLAARTAGNAALVRFFRHMSLPQI